MTEEKRPQDWSLEERLEMLIACGSLSKDELSKRCRREGLYSHHIKQWKLEFASGNTQSQPSKLVSDTKNLRHENKELKKQLNRKDKALAETAALLVLQKKVNAIWGSDEDNSQ
jgi:transposase-like protein